MNDKRPTILDVARQAGVSIGTVSNVLNGTIPVSEERRQRVHQAIEELSYTQNSLAQGLRRRRSPMVGLCVPHTTVAYFSKLVDAFEDVASSRGFEIMQILSHEDPRIEHQRVMSLLNYRIGGLILVPSLRPDKTLDAVARSGTPLVVVDRPVAPGRFDQVTFDNRAAMKEAVRRLVALGHRRILFVVRIRHLATTLQRVAALRAAAREATPPVTTAILECGNADNETITARVATVLRGPHPPTAIIVSNSTFAACMLRAFESLGVRYPGEISLLAFDQPEWADIVTPKLSVVRQPTMDVARTAWEFLIRRMEDPTVPVRTMELQAQVLLRASVAPPMPAPAPRATGRQHHQAPAESVPSARTRRKPRSNGQAAPDGSREPG
ncbi:MAG TPA: LacI family DNA-binding transcriptional regulator [Acetobacteraceae bacterium]